MFSQVWAANYSLDVQRVIEMRIFVTGDTHGDMDIGKLSAQNFPEGKNLC